MEARYLESGHLIEVCRFVSPDNTEQIRDDLMQVDRVVRTASGNLLVNGYFMTDGQHTWSSILPDQRIDVWTKEGLK